MAEEPESTLLTAMFDVKYIEQWLVRLGAEVQQLWERLRKVAGWMD